jgi:hypothetical protein
LAPFDLSLYNLALRILLGIFSFVFSLALSRLLDVKIVRVTKVIVNYFAERQKLRNFILNYF